MNSLLLKLLLLYFLVHSGEARRTRSYRRYRSRTTSPRTTTRRPSYSCDTDWILFEEHCYQSSGNHVTFYSDAQDRCKQLGANLVSILSHEEQEFLVKTFLKDKQHHWIGLSDQRMEGNFEWEDGNEFWYNHWLPGQPDNKGHADCASMHGGYEGQWDDSPCGQRTKKRRYICKKEPNISRK